MIGGVGRAPRSWGKLRRNAPGGDLPEPLLSASKATPAVSYTSGAEQSHLMRNKSFLECVPITIAAVLAVVALVGVLIHDIHRPAWVLGRDALPTAGVQR